MAERKYSVAEIDQMRWWVTMMYRGPINPTLIEERLRTYMLNGTTPKELEEACVAQELPKQFRAKPGSIYKIEPGSSFSDW